MGQPALKPQDVVVLAKLLTYQDRRPPLAQVAVDLAISASEVHAALKRLSRAGLVSGADVPIRQATEELFIHAVKYVFPAVSGEVTRGLPTSYAAAPLNREIVGNSELPPVWPFAEGTHRGTTFEPLYKTVPIAALRGSPRFTSCSRFSMQFAAAVHERRRRRGEGTCQQSATCIWTNPNGAILEAAALVLDSRCPGDLVVIGGGAASAPLLRSAYQSSAIADHRLVVVYPVRRTYYVRAPSPFLTIWRVRLCPPTPNLRYHIRRHLALLPPDSASDNQNCK